MNSFQSFTLRHYQRRTGRQGQDGISNCYYIRIADFLLTTVEHNCESNQLEYILNTKRQFEYAVKFMLATAYLLLPLRFSDQKSTSMSASVLGRKQEIKRQKSSFWWSSWQTTVCIEGKESCLPTRTPQPLSCPQYSKSFITPQNWVERSIRKKGERTCLECSSSLANL